jgi:hypothetical protein
MATDDVSEHVRRAKRDFCRYTTPYARRCATIELVCANLRHNTRLDRLTLRRRIEVDGH